MSEVDVLSASACNAALKISVLLVEQPLTLTFACVAVIRSRFIPGTKMVDSSPHSDIIANAQEQIPIRLWPQSNGGGDANSASSSMRKAQSVGNQLAQPAAGAPRLVISSLPAPARLGGVAERNTLRDRHNGEPHGNVSWMRTRVRYADKVG